MSKNIFSWQVEDHPAREAEASNRQSSRELGRGGKDAGRVPTRVGTVDARKNEPC